MRYNILIHFGISEKSFYHIAEIRLEAKKVLCHHPPNKNRTDNQEYKGQGLFQALYTTDHLAYLNLSKLQNAMWLCLLCSI